MEDFFKADGLSRIIFYFQEVENLPDAGTLISSSVISRVTVSKRGRLHVCWGLQCLHVYTCTSCINLLKYM